MQVTGHFFRMDYNKNALIYPKQPSPTCLQMHPLLDNFTDVWQSLQLCKLSDIHLMTMFYNIQCQRFDKSFGNVCAGQLGENS